MAILLVVDDSAQAGLILRKIGQRAGCEVVCHTGAERAWAWLQTARADVVLLDFNLPGANGAEFLAWLRDNTNLRDVPVALLGHWTRPAELVRGLEAGADLVFAKELLARPEACQRRLAEIIAWCAGRAAPASLRWQGTADLNRAVAQHIAARFGVELLPWLWRRAWRQAATAAPAVVPGDADWLNADGSGLKADARLPPAAGAALGFALAEALWCLVGTAGSAAFRAALEEGPAHS